jgi:hypothetical protein
MLKNILIFDTIFNDAPQPWQLGFQDSAILQRYYDFNIYRTIFWNILITIYSILFIYLLFYLFVSSEWINKLEIINWFEQSEEKNIIILGYLFSLSDYTYEFYEHITDHFLNLNSTALVLWGSNLDSSLGRKKLTKNVRQHLVLPHLYESILVGLLLSDGGINKSKTNKLMRIAFVQSFTIHFHYFMHVYFSLSFIFSSLPYLRIQYKKGIKNSSLYIISMGLPFIHNLCLQFIDIKGNKVIPKNINELLTPIALAHWIMGDGEARYFGLRLCTDSFSIPEVVSLINVLLIRYKIKSTLFMKNTPNGKKPRIVINSQELKKLSIIVAPYIIPQMQYKIKI